VDALASSALPATALTLEITETVLLDADAEAMSEVRKLYEHGVRLALDDFGTGYASLSQLTKLPISAIKIDRSFTTNMLHDRTCRALVRATVGIAEDLRMECIVEGVETEEHLAALPRNDRLLIQGYLYGRPRPAEEGLGVNLAHW
jgi:EAL domain-containing protein (putative c-di-GMP-specific phosphodiesterase class I)